MLETISDKYFYVKEKIIETCTIAGRYPSDVKLVVVTKGHSGNEINEVINAGATILGENYPEETLQKIQDSNLSLNLNWHMIGHIQSRKIKYLDPTFSLIHSIDSLEIAQKINNYYDQINKKIDCLVEINIAGELSKYGFDASSQTKRQELLFTFETLAKMKNICFRGLMTMPPYSNTEDQNKECYNLCSEYLHVLQNNIFYSSFKELSMGTSSDYSTAIKAGATYIRVGEAIMGPRQYKNKG